MNPFTISPLFVALTQGREESERNHIAFVAALATAIILIISALLGNVLLKLFGVDIAAVQVAGGIIIFLTGLGMVSGRGITYEPTEGERSAAASSVAVVPIAIPIAAGPGAISETIIWASENSGILNLAVGIGVVVAMSVILYFAFRYSSWLAAKLGENTLDIITRISGLILTAIAVNVIAVGLVGLLPGLG